ncbi:MAG: hypothetical protein A6F72_06375 [Cycloclasticus sp. symbiont of Poecilosclerida sp. N]|nr:MAG: hypothetical protein A6F72_06375 [Cycloclasticus sp. symbiont of Poecilosclerida sp. N]
MKKAHYFYEGETEEKLLRHLQSKKHLKPGRLRKYNLWETKFNLRRVINTNDHLFFFIDTDKTTCLSIFTKNIVSLEPYNICLMVQHKTFEDELCFACGKKSNRALYNDFYPETGAKGFKKKFIKENSLDGKLVANNFDHKKLWSRKTDFDNFLVSKGISIKALYSIKASPLL